MSTPNEYRGPGRPPTDGETRTGRVAVYLLPSEVAAIKAAARAAHQSQGDFVRQATLVALAKLNGGAP